MEKEEGSTVNALKGEVNIIYLPWGPEMLKSSPMLGSVYSRVKEPLRKTPSMYKATNRREKQHRET